MSDIQERRNVKRIDCYDQTLRNTDVEHSLVVDISNEGAGLLLQKEISFFRTAKNSKPDLSGNVHLNIFHPDSSLEKGLSINAEIIWIDSEYSGDHHKIGLKFIDLDQAQTSYVNKLNEWLSKEGHYFFHCELQQN